MPKLDNTEHKALSLKSIDLQALHRLDYYCTPAGILDYWAQNLTVSTLPQDAPSAKVGWKFVKACHAYHCMACKFTQRLRICLMAEGIDITTRAVKALIFLMQH